MSGRRDVAEWHERILNEALAWREAHPGFRFNLRRGDISGQNRLSAGYWFTGNDGYLFFAPFKPSDPHNKTRTIGFVITFSDGVPARTYLEIVFGASEPGEREFYEQLVRDLGGFRQVGTHKYQRDYEAADPVEAFRTFLEGDFATITRAVQDAGLDDKFIVDEPTFQEMLSTTQEVRRRPRTFDAPGGPGAGPAVSMAEGQSDAVNLILYGPPGTGKTHWLRQQFARYTDSASTVDRETWLHELVAHYGWRPVLAVAIAQMDRAVTVPEIKEHELVRAKILERGRTKAGVHQTIWGFLGEHTPPDVETVKIAVRRAPFIFTKSEPSWWNVLSDWRTLDEEAAELEAELLAGPGQDKEEIRRYRVVTFHPSFGYEDFVRGIRPAITAEDGTTEFRMVDGIFKQICDEARANPRKRYALFIDEINRANIAKVFGELITLIERDKRAVYDEKGRPVGGMLVSLPGSETSDVSDPLFGVPANLDIYGTMNTADRSIALLDIALRRRFEFQEMEPRHDLEELATSVDGLNLGRMLSRINDRLEYLLDRDHRIGHAYLLGLRSLDELRAAFATKVIPLLQEYFFDDISRVSAVLRTSAEAPPFVASRRWTRERLFPDVSSENIAPERMRYTITDPTSWSAASFAGIYATTPDAVAP